MIVIFSNCNDASRTYDPSSWNCLCDRTRKDQWTAILSCIYWVRCCVCLPRQGEEVSLADMECVQLGTCDLHQTQPVPHRSWRGRPPGIGKICGGHVWQIMFGHMCQRCTIKPICMQRLSIWWDILPPEAVLNEHAKRAAYQAEIIWRQATLPQPDVGTPANLGWVHKWEA